ncbi:MAG: hypothetical protein WCR55_13970 [Lentisphaerota bacterium]
MDKNKVEKQSQKQKNKTEYQEIIRLADCISLKLNNDEWAYFQNDKTMQKKFIKRLSKSRAVKQLIDSKSSFNINSLTEPDIEVIKNAVSLLQEDLFDAMP